MKKVLVRGPALTSTGYGEHCRFIMRSLRKLEDKIDLHLIPVNWGESNWIWEDNEERRWLDGIIKKTAERIQKNENFDVSLQVTIPNEWERMAPVNYGVTAGIETTKVAPIWLQKANEMDKIITISKHSKNSFTNTVYEGVDQRTGQKGILRCATDIEIVHYPVKHYFESKFTNLFSAATRSIVDPPRAKVFTIKPIFGLSKNSSTNHIIVFSRFFLGPH